MNDSNPNYQSAIPASPVVGSMVNPFAIIESFDEFDAWLEVELNELEKRFSDFATTNSYRHFMGR